jgi:molecular chaperone DnaJ
LKISNDFSDPVDTNASTTDGHKNEGFLKSLWHKVTDHAEHCKDDSSKEQPKKDEEAPKKDDKEPPK